MRSTDSLWRGFGLLLVSLGAATLPAPASSAIYRVGSGSGCTHGTIQAAVEAARVNPGFDYIRITRSRTYLDQRVVINSQNVQLEGGFANCASPSADGTRTVVSGAGALRGSVFAVSGTGNVTFADLELNSGDPTGDGGGLAVANTSSTVTLLNVRVVQNAASRGGGISVRGSSSNPAALRLVLGPGTVVESNRASTDGGGIYCRFARVEVTGARSRITANHARRGGGMHLEACGASIRSEGNYPAYGVLAFNTAEEDGGGISVTERFGRAWFAPSSAGAPVWISYNRAGRFGGGAYVADALFEMMEGILEGNVAGEGGGGAFLEVHEAQDPGQIFVMPGQPSGSVPYCTAALNCNRISGNRARASDGSDRDGAAIMVRARYGEGEARSIVRLWGTQLSDNAGRSLLRHGALSTGFGSALNELYIAGALITRNRASGSLIDYYSEVPEAWDYTLGIGATTIAGNVIGGPAVIDSYWPIGLDYSIVWQPGTRAIATDVAYSGANLVEYVIANDFTGVPMSPRLLIADPAFNNPANGDFELRPESPAIDFAPEFGHFTRNHRPRPVDLPSIPNRFGPEDLGAYERQTDPGSVIGPG
jgi:hypothetical protein